MSETTLIGAWLQRYGAILSELENTTLTVQLAARQLAAAMRTTGSDTQPGRRALRTALERLSFTLRRADAVPAVPAQDTDQQFRAALAGWLDTVTALRAALRHLDTEHLQHGIRAGEAANSALLAAQRSLRRLPALRTIQQRQHALGEWPETVALSVAR